MTRNGYYAEGEATRTLASVTIEAQATTLGSAAVSKDQCGSERGPGRSSGPSGALAPDAPRWRVVRLVGTGAVALWVTVLAALSFMIHHRSFLAEDFGIYSQAWTRIGQGHLNPYSTVYGYPFVKGDLEVIMWPLALLHLITSNSVVLLWVQDLAIAACGLVTFLWVLEYLERRGVSWQKSAGIGAAVLVVFMIDPNVYGTVGFDFHIEPMSTVFVLLAGRDVWRGRNRRAWLWVAGVLLCGSFASITLVGLGLSALIAGPATRRTGMLVIATGLGWLALISLLHANAGSGLAEYAYLAGRKTIAGPSGMALLATGIAIHPWRVTHQIQSRLAEMYLLLKPVGVIGMATAWGFGVPFAVMVTDALNGNPAFILDSFQNFAVFPFVLFGTVVALVWMVQRVSWGWVPATILAMLFGLQALVYGMNRSPEVIRWTVSRVDAAEGASLRSTLTAIPPDAEVIASMSLMGSFCQREFCYFALPGHARPVQSSAVVFIFIPAHDPFASAADSAAGIAYVRDQLHARPLAAAAGISAFEWLPPKGTSSVIVPGAAEVPNG